MVLVVTGGKIRMEIMSKEMEIIINPDGTVEIEMFGMHGKGCSEIIKKMTDALGQPIKSEKKPEYYREDQQDHQHVRRDL